MAISSPMTWFIVSLSICWMVCPSVADERQAMEKLNAVFGMYQQDEEGHVVKLELSHGVQLIGEQIRATDVYQLLGDLPHLEHVELAEHQVDDDVLSQLGKIAGLQSLTLSNTTFSDHGLQELVACKSLKKLYLPACGLTDNSLTIIGQIASLEDLGLRDNPLLTDEGLNHLANLKKLTILRFRGSQVTSQSIERFCDLPLTALGLGACQIDASVMKSIGKLKSLKALYLDKTQISDESLQALVSLPIENMGLARTSIGDPGVKFLSQIKTLRNLWITETEITEASIDEIRKLENLEILMLPKRFTQASGQRLCKDRPKLSVLGVWNQNSWSHLRDINAALVKFHDNFKAFPSTTGANQQGKPRISWRVAILPYIGEWQLFEKFHFDEPWDSPHNLTLLPLMPRLFIDPHRPTDAFHTVYQAAIGDSTLLRAVDPSSLEQATDGLKTITVVVTTSQLAVPWTSPQDYNVDLTNPTRDLIQDGVGIAALADETFRTFDDELDPAILKAMYTRDANN